MPQVVSTLCDRDHAALKKRAAIAHRSMGNQLIVEAFSKAGLAPPALPTSPTKRTAGRAKI